MELTYDHIVNWMKEYFQVYSKYGQDPVTAHRMNNYFALDLEFIPYIAALQGPVTNRDAFLRNTTSHPSSYEKLTPEDIAVDERRKVVVALLRLQIIDRKTEEVLVEKSSIAHYQLVLDENKTLKIKKIQFFWQDLPPGALEVVDVFARDHVD
jgi:hypothetical protein